MKQLLLSLILLVFIGGFVKAQRLADVYNTRNGNLPADFTTAFLQSADGSRIIGTQGAGLVRVSSSGVTTVFNTSNSGIGSNFIASLAQTANGDIWVGTNGGGLSHFSGGVWSTFTIFNSGLPSNNVRSIATQGNNLLVATQFGLSFYSDATGWNTLNAGNSTLPSSNISTVHIDALNRVWVGTVGGGIAVQVGTNSFQTYNISNSGLQSNDIRAITSNSGGVVFAATAGGGFAVFNFGFWQPYTALNSGLPDNFINGIAVDRAGIIWLATNTAGLLAFDGKDYHRFNTSNSSIPTNQLLSVQVDSRGNKWITSPGGLVHFLRSVVRLRSFGATEFCPSGNTTLQAYTSASTVFYSWKRDNLFLSATDSLLNINQGGVYQVTVTDTGGYNMVSFPLTIRVLQPPVARITALGNTNICNGQSLLLKAAWRAGYNYIWKRDGNIVQQGADSLLTVTGPGNYKVIVSTGENCVDSTVNFPVAISAQPTAAILPVPTSVCLGTAFTFKANRTSNIANGVTGVTYNWNFGNGATAIGDSVVFNYPLAGTYTVRLIARTASCTDTDFVTVQVINQAVAGIRTLTANVCNGNAVVLQNFSTGAIRYRWNFGTGDSLETTSDSSITYFFPTAGIYTVRLTAFNSLNCSTQAQQAITVTERANVAFAASPLDGCGPLTVNFQNNTTGPAIRYVWKFSETDSVVTTSASPVSRTFPSSLTDRTTRVTLRAVTANGCSDSVGQTITIFGKPRASIQAAQLGGCSPFNIQLANLSTGGVRYTWKVGTLATFVRNDLGSLNYTLINTSNANITVPVTLIAQSANGCIDSTIVDLLVYPEPTVNFNINGNSALGSINGCSPLTVNFTDITGGLFQYQWQIEGVNSARFNNSDFSYRFVNRGTEAVTYPVRLIGINAQGCADTIVKNIIVDPQPAAAFATSVLSGCSPITITFTNLSNAANGYTWFIGSRVVSTSSTAPFNLDFDLIGANDSLVPVTLIARNIGGCFDTSFTTLTISRRVRADFAINGSIVPNQEFCAGTSVALSNNSTNANTYLWKVNGVQFFGTNSAATFNLPLVNTSTTADSLYTIRLISLTSDICIDSLERTIIVKPQPIAGFQKNGASGCSPLRIAFANRSSGGTVARWFFGGSNGFTDSTTTAASANLIRTFTGAATTDSTVYIKLRITNNIGCVSEFLDSVRVRGIIQAIATPAITQNCGSATVTFTNNSLNASNYIWTASNGQTINRNTTSPVSFTFTNPFRSRDSIYTVRLIARNSLNCTDTQFFSVPVFPRPISSFTIDSLRGCSPLTNTFRNNSFGANNYTWIFGTDTVEALTNLPIAYTFRTPNRTDTFVQIRLIARNTQGCADTFARSIQLYRNPIAGFTTSRASGCSPADIAIINTSNDAATYFKYLIGNTDTVFVFDRANVNRTLINTTTRDSLLTIRQIAFSALGCTDTTTRTFTIYSRNNIAQGCIPTNCAEGNVRLTAVETPIRLQMDASAGVTAVAYNPTSQLYYSPVAGNDTLDLNTYDATGSRINNVEAGFDYRGLWWNPATNQLEGNGFFDNGWFAARLNPAQVAISGGTTLFEGQLQPGAQSVGAYDFASNEVLYLNGLQVARYSRADGLLVGTVNLSGLTNSSTQNWNRTVLYSGIKDKEIAVINTSYNRIYFFNKATGLVADSANLPTNLSIPNEFNVSYANYLLWVFDASINSWRSFSIWNGFNEASPTLAVSPNVAICEGGNTSLVATGGVNYSWRPTAGLSSANTASVIATPLGTTQYFLTSTDANGCQQTKAVLVTVQPRPFSSIVIDSLDYRSNIVNDTLRLCAGNNVAFAADTIRNSNRRTFRKADGYRWQLSRNGTLLRDTCTRNFAWNFAQSGTYTVALTTSTDTCGSAFSCSNTDVAIIQIDELPEAVVAVIDTNALTPAQQVQLRAGNPALIAQLSLQAQVSGCGRVNATFLNDTRNASRHVWKVNGATILSSNNRNAFTRTFTNTAVAGSDSIYNIEYIAFSNNGCETDTVRKQIIVRPAPRANFNIDADGGCSPLTVNFTNLSSNAVNYAWDFGDGTTSTSSANSFSKVYVNNGTNNQVVQARLVVQSAFGCYSDTVVKLIAVNRNNTTILPSASFAINGNTAVTDTIEGCNAFNVAITNTTLNATGYTWYIRNQSGVIIDSLVQGRMQNFTYLFENRNEVSNTASLNRSREILYTLELKATNCANQASRLTRVIRVRPATRAVPILSVGSFNNCGTTKVNFRADTSIGAATYNWVWSNGYTSNAVSDSVILNNTTGIPQTIRYTLTATSPNGCSFSKTDSLLLYPAVNADVQIDSWTFNTTISGTNLGTGPLSNDNNDSTFCGNTFVNFYVPLTTARVQAFFHDGTTTVANSPFSVGTPNVLDAAYRLAIQKNYVNNSNTTQTLVAKLLLTNFYGCVSDTIYKQFIIEPTAEPVVSVNNTIYCSEDTIVATTQAFAGATYKWITRNGSVSQIFSTTEPTLIVVLSNNGNNAQTASIQAIRVNAGGCNVAGNPTTFTLQPKVIPQMALSRSIVGADTNYYLPTVLCDSGVATIFNFSKNANQYRWYVNGVLRATTQNLVNYNFSGLPNDTVWHYIALEATNTITGCTDIQRHTFKVLPQRTATFTVNTNSACSPAAISFTYEPRPWTNEVYFWNFDGAADTLRLQANQLNSLSDQTLRRTYLNTDTTDRLVPVSLVIINTYGCADTIKQTITVRPGVTAGFTSLASVCSGEPLSFTNTSSTSAESYLWNFGGQGTSTDANPSFTFINNTNAPQNVQVSLRATNTGTGTCTNVITRTISVLPSPIVAVSSTTTIACAPFATTLTATNAIAGSRFDWDFGNGQTRSNTGSTVNYTFSGIISDSFDVAVNPRVWASHNGTISQACGALNGNALYFNGAGPRQLVSQDFEFTNGATLSFALKNGSGGSGCDFAEPNKPVLIQFSTNGGTTWNTISTINLELFTNWTTVSQALPIAARTIATRIRLVQLVNEGVGFDNWSVENVAIAFNGSFVVRPRVSVTSPNGCKSVSETPITVLPSLQVGFDVNADTLCSPARFSFTNTTNASATNFTWNLGDGRTLTTRDVQALYFNNTANDRTLTVSVTASNSQCSQTISKQIVVVKQPAIAFTASQTAFCGPELITLRANVSNIQPTRYRFIFGDGDSLETTANTVQHTYSNLTSVQNLVRTARVIAFSPNGCPDTASISLTVFPNIDLGFDTLNSAGCSPLVVAFRNTTSTNPFFAAPTLAWDFGNGQTSTDFEPIATFTNGSTSLQQQYTVTLRATAAYCTKVFRKTYTVFAKPNIGLVSSASNGCAPLNVRFTASGVNISEYRWNFNDGTAPQVTNTASIEKVFGNTTGAPQTYNVQVIAVSANGCTDTAFRSITVNPGVLANFTAPAIGCAPLQVQFNNTSSNARSYLWNFGGGATSTATNPTFSLVNNTSSPITYTVSLTAFGDNGCFNTTSQTIRVFPLGATAADLVASDSVGCGPFNVNFSAPTGNFTSFAWNYADGTTETTTVGNARHTFRNTGSLSQVYNVQVRATTAEGCEITLTKRIRVNPEVTAGFNLPDTLCSGTRLAIPNTTTGATSFLWDFGFGQTSTLERPNRLFANNFTTPRVFTVRLTATGLGGCNSTFQKNIVVLPKGNNTLTVNRTTGCGVFSVQFTANVVAGATYNFIYGDGNQSGFVSTNQRSYTYQATANSTQIVYPAQVLIRLPNGCTDTLRQGITAYPRLEAEFNSSVTEGCGPLRVVFANQSTFLADNFQWNFAGLGTSTQRNPVFTFPNQGTDTVQYRVRLIARSLASAGGCTDTTFQTITVYPQPLAAFEPELTVGACANVPYRLFNNSRGAVEYRWDYGSGSSFTTRSDSSVNPVFFNNSPNERIYSVRLFATSRFGCIDTATLNILVAPVVAPIISTNTTDGCSPLLVNFNSSLSTGVTQFTYQFADGSAEEFTNNASHTFVNNTTRDTIYQVRVTGANAALGCSNTQVVAIRVRAKPNATLITDLSEGITPLTVNFRGGEAGIIAWRYLIDGRTIDRTSGNLTYTLVNNTRQTQVFPVSLITRNVNGCLDTAIQNITVFPRIEFDFTLSDTTDCNALFSQVTSISDSADALNWTFSNAPGTFSTERRPGQLFRYEGLNDTTYTFTMVAYKIYSPVTIYADTVVKTVRLVRGPVARFTVNDTVQCTGAVYRFSAKNSLRANRFEWDFGNGVKQVTVDSVVTIAYDNLEEAPRQYRVILKAENTAEGCFDTAQLVVTVFPTIRARMGIATTDGCARFKATFSGIISSAANKFYWNFGDGTIDSTNLAPDHTYVGRALDTTYLVQLIAINTPSGCTDTVTQLIRVRAKPLAQFTASETGGCGSLRVALNSEVRPANLFYDWNFGDGNTLSNTSPGTVYTYINSGTDTLTRTIRLIVRSGSGCLDTTEQTFIIYPRLQSDLGPNVNINGCSPFTLPITNRTVGANRYLWNFGDGTTSAAQFPNKVYTYTGSRTDTTYILKFVAWTETAGTVVCEGDSITQVIRVGKQVFANATASNNNVCDGTVVRLGASLSRNANQFTWNFGDGQTLTTSDTAVNFNFRNNLAVVRTFRVTLTATNTAANCSDTSSVLVTVAPQVSAVIETSDTSGCAPYQVVFNSLISASADKFVWDFGDGTKDSTNRTLTYQYAGRSADTVYQVRLRAENTVTGCTSESSVSVRVKAAPIAFFTLASRGFCGNVEVNLLATAIPANRIYRYDMGDGTVVTTNSATFSHTYFNGTNVPITYLVRMRVTGISGCFAEYSQSVIVYPALQTRLSGTNIVTGCANLPLNFTNNTIGANQHLWIFGDGTTSNLRQPTKTYTYSGVRDTTYNLKYVGWYQEGDSIICSGDTIARTIRIFARPVAQLNIFGSPICSGNQVRVNALGTLGAQEFFFDMGDGNVIGPRLDTAGFNYTYSHLSDRPENFIVKLIAVNRISGCSDTASLPVVVNPQLVSRILLADSVSCAPYRVQFQGIISNSVTNWRWDFGTGRIDSVNRNPVVIFPSPVFVDTTYIVRLSVRNRFTGCSSFTERTIRVRAKPIAQFNLIGGNECGVVGIEANAVEAPANARYTWFVGEGTRTFSGPNLIYQYRNNGVDTLSRTIRLIVTSPSGCTDTAEQTIPLYPALRTNIGFDLNITGCSPFRLNLANATTGATEQRWIFGDGSPDQTTAQPNKVYTYTGSDDTTFTLRYIANVRKGGQIVCTDTLIRIITIFGVPNAAFVPSDTAVCSGTTISFFNQSTRFASVQWSWDDGSPDERLQANPVHTFINRNNSDEVYRVRLIVRNGFGCADTSFRNIRVTPNPVALFQLQQPVLTQPVTTVTILNRAINPQGYISVWNYGDGSRLDTNNGSQVTHTYNITSTLDTSFTITQRVFNNLGCSSEFSQVVRIIQGVPAADFTFTNGRGCPGLPVTFTSTAVSARFYQWEFGDGGSSFDPNPTHVYLRPGTFTVRLTVVGLGGSTNVVKNGIITISTKPEANFDVLNNFVVPDERVVFNNNSRGAIRYLWQFGDGDTSSLETPEHKYLQSGRYTVTLIAYNANGCADTFAIRDVIEVEKTARILIPNAFTPNPDFENDGSIFNTELNDVFYPVTRGAVSFRLEIYNRWGQLMFESKDKEKGWNGYHQGKLCPGGSYTYRLDVQFADGQTEVKFGDVTLIR